MIHKLTEYTNYHSKQVCYTFVENNTYLRLRNNVLSTTCHFHGSQKLTVGTYFIYISSFITYDDKTTLDVHVQ